MFFTENEDSDDEQENIATYREYTNDLFFNTYHLVGEYKGRAYKEMFENFIMEYFETSEGQDVESYFKQVESAIFAAKSVIDACALPEDEIIKKVWTAILRLK